MSPVRNALQATPSRRRARAAAAVVLLAAVFLAGCSISGGAGHTQGLVDDAGFSHATITAHTTSGQVDVDVAVLPASSHASIDYQARTIARIVWQNLPGRFATLRVTFAGRGARTFSHLRLEVLFGTRPATLDQEKVANGEGTDGSVLLGVGLAFLTVVVALMWFSVVRLRRQQRRAAASRAALIMTTLPPEVWGVAGGDAPTMGPAPPPPVPPPPVPPPPMTPTPTSPTPTWPPGGGGGAATGSRPPGPSSPRAPLPPPVAPWPFPPPKDRSTS